MTYTTTNTYTYSTTDIETVVRRFTADIVMIAQSSGAITEPKAREYAHDIEILAKKGYLKTIDLTLFSGSTEIRATQYEVNADAGNLSMSRPGGVLWPRVNNPHLQIILLYSDSYDAAAKEVTKEKLKVNWTPTYADTNHFNLTSSGGRNYASNGWGMQRKDYSL